MMKTKTRGLLLPFAGLLIIVFHLAPLYITLSIALKKMTDLSSRWTIPNYLYWQNFVDAINSSHMLRAFTNSFVITVGTSFLIIMIGAMAAYPLARVRTKTNKWILNLVLTVMMIPTLSIIVPLYKVMNDMHAINTFWGVILVLTTHGLPLAIFTYANFIRTIPRDLDEAATVDGCNGYSVFFRILLPQLKPVTATVLILAGLKVWNDFEFALYFLQKPQKQTITLTIANFFSEFSSNINAAAAAALLAVLPVTIMFIFLQKYFISGLSDGAVK
ncbi:carbohydrate ABC transporter membrane protein 2 (CUT1 family) [Cohnella sp. SGD-V74]|nr:carbohydrate ABC transporter membrane protein 2 (CUT1 family) [Cohnella sp. SGD-V74]